MPKHCRVNRWGRRAHTAPATAICWTAQLWDDTGIDVYGYHCEDGKQYHNRQQPKKTRTIIVINKHDGNKNGDGWSEGSLSNFYQDIPTEEAGNG